MGAFARLSTSGLAVAFMATAMITAAHAGPPERVVFGGDATYPPFEWDDNGTPAGFNIDLADALAEAGGAEAAFRLADWPDILRALEDGDVDVVPMFVSEDRERRFRFTSAFYYVNHAIYAAPGTPSVSSVGALDGQRVAVEQSSYAHNRLQGDGTGAIVVLAGNTLGALNAVADGDADYALLAVPSADRLIRQNDLPIASVGPPFWPQAYAFAVRKDRAELAHWLEQSLTLTIGSGRYEQIYERWRDELTPSATTTGDILRGALIVIALLVVLAGLGFGWSWSLRRTVAARTALLRDELRLREAAEAQLRHLADHDRHTGLPEYHHLVELTDKLLRRSEDGHAPTRETVVLKLAELEAIVRTFGYAAGREVVRAFAERLNTLEFDVCGYLGRGVFAIVGRKDAVNDNLEALTSHLSVTDLSLYPLVAGGVAHWPDHADNAMDMVRRAETALAAGIARNASWAVYDPAMEPDPRDLQIVTAFRQSAGEGMHAVLQPQVDLRTGRIVAAEALVRWTHPDLGFIPPDKFIPLLERSGLIGRVTTRMIDEAVRIAADLRRAHRPCTISVNVAAHDLLATDLSSIIAAALARHGGRPGDLKLELTETSVMEDPAHVAAVLERLSRAGIDASIDDFGTGYSSLSYLIAFPIRELKIDRAFVGDMLRNARNRSIVRSTIAMAHELGLTVVAEGAEDMATVEALKTYGCGRVQGYAISKPLTEEAFLAFLERDGVARNWGAVA